MSDVKRAKAKQGKRRKLVWLYGGFIDGHLAVYQIDDMSSGENIRRSPAIFMTRIEAAKQFEDVRKVQVIE